MELKDFVVTPIVIFIIYVLAYIIRPRVTDSNTRRYFIPALTVKIIGAIAVGLIYQFYYGGGDTFAFFTRGSSIIYKAFIDSPVKGFKLLMANGEFDPSTFEYASRIFHYHDAPSYFVVKVAAFIGLFTFNTYSAVAVVFATLSFTGVWAMFLTFYKLLPNIRWQIALAVLFIPSLFFWGSGLLKDTLTLGAIGWGMLAFYQIFICRKRHIIYFLTLVTSLYVIYKIKFYILLIFIPALIVWFFAQHFKNIRSRVIKILLFPMILALVLTSIYGAVLNVGEFSEKYALDNIAETAKITAYDIRYYTGKDAGSGYVLGQLDGSFESLLKLAPEAINVSLFRPYIWEVKNPLMLMSSLESLFFIILTLLALFRTKGLGAVKKASRPEIIFCLTFSLAFAFAVGVSTYNFGSLSRYKIPLIPFFLVSMFYIGKREPLEK